MEPRRRRSEKRPALGGCFLEWSGSGTAEDPTRNEGSTLCALNGGERPFKKHKFKKLNLIFSFGVRAYFFCKTACKGILELCLLGVENFEFFVRFEVLEVSELVNFVFYGIII